MKNKINIIGAGPSGLFSAYQLLKKGYEVDLYDHMSGVGKKFLVAGIGGLNLTHSENLEHFSKKYGKNEALFKKLVQDFSADDLRSWCKDLGVETFVGSSGRVFPKEFKAADLLKKWMTRLKTFKGFRLFLNYKLIEVSKNKKDKSLTFKNNNEVINVRSDQTILALGGASWKKTGSDGEWKNFLEKAGIKINPFLPMNCGFERKWSDHFIEKVDRSPLKNISLSFGEKKVFGEVMLTPFGIEGGAIYAISNLVRDTILKNKTAVVYLDLKPSLSLQDIVLKLESKKASVSFSNHLRKSLKMDKVTILLIHELIGKEKFNTASEMAKCIKNLPIELLNTRPIDEAISTSGGVSFNSLNENMEVFEIKGLYIIGEMLDFEAPTGGYLLQGCFSTSQRVINPIPARKK